MAVTMIDTTKCKDRKELMTPKVEDVNLLSRTSWVDARIALTQIRKQRATGNEIALKFRTKFQQNFYQLGCFIHRHSGKVLFLGLLVLSTFCVGLKSAKFENNVEKLWVEEGGRLEKEMAYTKKILGEGAGEIYHVIIQTPKQEGASLLNRDAFLIHLKVLQAAIAVSVDLFDITWRLKDLCVATNFPLFDSPFLDQIFENISPCTFITPLDCFWEGSKLLGPEYPVAIPLIGPNVKWTNLHPARMVDLMKDFPGTNGFPFASLEDFMKRAGITSAYQAKPCLDPFDPECPDTAPNKKSKTVPDIGAEVTGGCYGFSKKHMHWQEDLIVGGTRKNKTGHITRAAAIQTIVKLQGEKDLYDYWSDTYKVHSIDWSVEKAAMVLDLWQRKFMKEIRSLQSTNATKTQMIHAFSSESLSDLLSEISEVDIPRLAIGYGLMLVYSAITLIRWSEPVKSQSGIGIAGVFLASVTIVAALGFCAVIGVVFNATTIQIVPFLLLGLGVNGMFLMAHVYGEISSSDIPSKVIVGEILKRCGLNIFITSSCQICAFFAAAIVPIPALRSFSLQAGVLVLFNVATLLLVFPAIISLDLRRRNLKKRDLLCCVDGDTPTNNYDEREEMIGEAISSHVGTPIPTKKAVSVPYDRKIANQELWVGAKPLMSGNGKSKDVEAESQELENCLGLTEMQVECMKHPVSSLAENYFAKFIVMTPVKVLTIFCLIVSLAASIWGLTKVQDGLDLTEVVPRTSPEHGYLKAQNKYFGFHIMHAVTQGNFEYPTNQKLLHEYHEAFMRVSKIIKNDDGGLPEFWLSRFREWLSGLQRSFDRDWTTGCITRDQWFQNASDEGVLAYKLLVQTGHVDYPVDKSLVTQVRLVDSEGVINPKAFYNYLSAWIGNDAIAYSESQAMLKPEPRQFIHDARDVELRIPKSSPIIYAQLPFYLKHLVSTEDMVETIQETRAVCKKFEEKGLPNYPRGIPFTFWEQYINLRRYLLLALGSILGAVLTILTILLFNLWAALVVVFVLFVIIIELVGLMGLLGIKLSAIPAVLLIVAVGIGVDFAAHILIGFITSIGNRNRRVGIAVKNMMAPIVDGAVSTILGIAMLAFSEFDFIVKYFFYILCLLILLGVFNGLVLLPVILSIMGPPGEMRPRDGGDHIEPPTPEPSPIPERVRNSSNRIQVSKPLSQPSFTPRRSNYPRGSEISLTTITEEPQSWHSGHEIVVKPEVVVETTTYNNGCSSGSNRQSSSSSSSSGSDSVCTNSSSDSLPDSPVISRSSHVTTKVTATTKVKVEVHTPTYDHRVRRNRRDSSSGSGRSDSEDEARRSRSSNAVQYRRGR
ncbi:protein patched-like isoform X2 [Artemia franciscana]|uniref:SSD domain-containing protein n=1 Tax=Artemia franciscana TaxID=6661 RepID=A0AA88IEI5_ARTSF|nr:hypothetical protein QYM36_003122 [Artemia franciscana]